MKTFRWIRGFIRKDRIINIMTLEQLDIVSMDLERKEKNMLT